MFEIFRIVIILLPILSCAKVAEVVGICKSKGYVLPGIYQAMYNGITRAIEPELVPCLRKNNIRLVIYNPLAGTLIEFLSNTHNSQTSIF